MFHGTNSECYGFLRHVIAYRVFVVFVRVVTARSGVADVDPHPRPRLKHPPDLVDRLDGVPDGVEEKCGDDDVDGALVLANDVGEVGRDGDQAGGVRPVFGTDVGKGDGGGHGRRRQSVRQVRDERVHTIVGHSLAVVQNEVGPKQEAAKRRDKKTFSVDPTLSH